MYSNNLISKEEYDEVLEVGNEVIEVIRKLELRIKNIGTMLSFSETAHKIDYLLGEYNYYLKLLIEKYNKVENVEHSYYTLLSQISRLQEKAGKRRNG